MSSKVELSNTYSKYLMMAMCLQENIVYLDVDETEEGYRVFIHDKLVEDDDSGRDMLRRVFHGYSLGYTHTSYDKCDNIAARAYAVYRAVEKYGKTVVDSNIRTLQLEHGMPDTVCIHNVDDYRVVSLSVTDYYVICPDGEVCYVGPFTDNSQHRLRNCERKLISLGFIDCSKMFTDIEEKLEAYGKPLPPLYFEGNEIQCKMVDGALHLSVESYGVVHDAETVWSYEQTRCSLYMLYEVLAMKLKEQERIKSIHLSLSPVELSEIFLTVMCSSSRSMFLETVMSCHRSDITEKVESILAEIDEAEVGNA